MSFASPQSSTSGVPTPKVGEAPAPPPMFGANLGMGKKPKTPQPSFLGTGLAPEQGQLGQKTLLGQ